MLGNDIVSLCCSDSPNYQHVRHLDRICSSEEIAFVHSAANPSLAAAAIWAAKESAYKLHARKQRLLFIPKKFSVQLNKQWQLQPNSHGFVEYGEARMRLELSLTPAWVHAVAVSSNVHVARWSVRNIAERFTGGHQAQNESEAVRYLAAELISQYCPENVYLTFHGRLPALQHSNGNPVGIEISLSHHGDFAAAALAWTVSSTGERLSDPEISNDTTGRLQEERCSTFMA